MKKAKNTVVPGFVMLGFFLIFTIIVKTVDVKPVGPNGSVVGLSSINVLFRDMIGLSDFWYKLTECYGYISIGLMFGFALIGLFQLITRKKIAKIDKELFILAGFYIIVAGFYALFEVLVINFRPVILSAEEGLEASYPSSHTFLIVFVMGSTAVMSNVLGKQKKKFVSTIVIICYLIIVTAIIGRLLSGVHWFTDIFAGAVLALGLLMLFKGAIGKIEEKKV